MSFRRKLLFLLYIAVFRHTPDAWRPYALFFPRLRRWLVRGFVLHAGDAIVVKSNAEISPNIRIGDRSELGQNSLIYAGVEIGCDVLMGPGVKIITRNHIVADRSIPIRLQGETFQAVTIGDDVWIGANVVILPGVEIGKGAVVAAGAVVAKSVAPYSIVGGVPARVISQRGGS